MFSPTGLAESGLASTVEARKSVAETVGQTLRRGALSGVSGRQP